MENNTYMYIGMHKLIPVGQEPGSPSEVWSTAECIEEL